MTTSIGDSVTGLRAVSRAPRSAAQGPSRRGLERAHPHQVVGRHGEQKLPVHPPSTAAMQLAQPADRFHPAEGSRYPLAGALADRVARMLCRPPIEGATFLHLCDMRRGLQGAQRVDEAVRVVCFVAADGDAPMQQIRDQRRDGDLNRLSQITYRRK
jgi:hypothetical protein